MTVTSSTCLLHTNEIDVRELPEDVDLVELIRRAQDDPELGTACSWVLSYADDEVPWYMSPALMVGVRVGTGALVWDDRLPLRPTNGTNAEPVDYWLGGPHHTPMEARTEIPGEQTLAAVAEFVRTGRRPTCVEWQPIGS